MRISLVLGTLLGLALAAGCDPYDPDLGDRPFLCGTSEPRCPDGYGPDDSSGRCLCEKGVVAAPLDAAGPSADSAVDCVDDSAITGDPGGNDTLTMATQTPVGSGASTYSQPGLSICPGNDIDVFKLRTVTAGSAIHVAIQYNKAYGDLEMAILDSNGVPVAPGVDAPTGAQATYSPAPINVYYAQVRSATATVNNYSIQIEIQ